MSEQADCKRMTRADLRERRQTMGAYERATAAKSLTTQLKNLVIATEATSISCFVPTPSEPDVREFLDWAATAGIRVLLPISREDGLLDWTIGNHTDSTTGLYGMPEPDGERLGPIAIGAVDLLLIPAAAVDMTGLRLGWGRGYYDRTLGSMQRRPPTYAVVFDHEVLDEVPHEIHDQPVDGVVTPRRTIHFSHTVPKHSKD